MLYTATHRITKFVLCLTFGLASLAAIADTSTNKATTLVSMKTSMGEIKLELFDDKTPDTVKNFVDYTNNGFYDGTIFHRVIPNFMIQGGGFDPSLNRKPTHAPIQNEANAFIPNVRGTISMARTSDPHSATSQFFINTENNKSLDKTSINPGYAVFGRVIDGMKVVDAISSTQTGIKNGMRDVPTNPIIIEKVSVTAPTASK